MKPFPKIRDITLKILLKCGIDSPPVDINIVLERWGVLLEESENLRQSALQKTADGSWKIVVSRELRHERRDFRIAHELGHVYWMDPKRHRGDPALGGKLENYCSKFASLLLCPHQWLVSDARELDYDLGRLKEIYNNVSYEALAIRISYLTQVVVTIIDNGKRYRRFSTEGLRFPAEDLPVEVKVHEECDLYSSFREKFGTVKLGGTERKIRVRGYPVISGAYRRIILLTTFVDSILSDSAEPDFEKDMPYPFPEY